MTSIEHKSCDGPRLQHLLPTDASLDTSTLGEYSAMSTSDLQTIIETNKRRRSTLDSTQFERDAKRQRVAATRTKLSAIEKQRAAKHESYERACNEVDQLKEQHEELKRKFTAKKQERDQLNMEATELAAAVHAEERNLIPLAEVYAEDEELREIKGKEQILREAWRQKKAEVSIFAGPTPAYVK